MDPALAGLLGALVGGTASLVGAWLSARQPASQEAPRWLRQRKTDAYGNAMRPLLRLMFRRSKINVEGGRLTPILSNDDIPKWFDDLAEAQYWMSQVTIVAGERQVPRLQEARELLSAAATAFILRGEMEALLPVKGESPLNSVYQALLECARDDARSVELH